MICFCQAIEVTKMLRVLNPIWNNTYKIHKGCYKHEGKFFLYLTKKLLGSMGWLEGHWAMLEMP
jgi:hypothetical protein